MRSVWPNDTAAGRDRGSPDPSIACDGLGFEFWVEVRGMFESIRMNPDAGSLWRPPEPFRKRVLSRFPFIVFYTIRPDALVVEAVAHGARRPGYWLARAKP